MTITYDTKGASKQVLIGWVETLQRDAEQFYNGMVEAQQDRRHYEGLYHELHRQRNALQVREDFRNAIIARKDFSLTLKNTIVATRESLEERAEQIGQDAYANDINIVLDKLAARAGCSKGTISKNLHTMHSALHIIDYRVTRDPVDLLKQHATIRLLPTICDVNTIERLEKRSGGAHNTHHCADCGSTDIEIVKRSNKDETVTSWTCRVCGWSKKPKPRAKKQQPDAVKSPVETCFHFEMLNTNTSPPLVGRTKRKHRNQSQQQRHPSQMNSAKHRQKNQQFSKWKHVTESHVRGIGGLVYAFYSKRQQ